MKYCITILLAIALFSCQKPANLNSELPLPNNLAGSWVNPIYTDSTIVFEKSQSVGNDEYGITLLSDGSLIEHKNSGWCGTPPISYADFNGVYTLKDSVLKICVGFWGGVADYQWKIVSLTDKQMKVINLNENYTVQPN